MCLIAKVLFTERNSVGCYRIQYVMQYEKSFNCILQFYEKLLQLKKGCFFSFIALDQYKIYGFSNCSDVVERQQQQLVVVVVVSSRSSNQQVVAGYNIRGTSNIINIYLLFLRRIPCTWLIVGNCIKATIRCVKNGRDSTDDDGNMSFWKLRYVNIIEVAVGRASGGGDKYCHRISIRRVLFFFLPINSSSRRIISLDTYARTRAPRGYGRETTLDLWKCVSAAAAVHFNYWTGPSAAAAVAAPYMKRYQMCQC